MRKTWFIIFIGFAAGLAILAKLCCSNMPWPAESVSSNTFFTSVSSAVKGLDPATSYYVHESAILDNVVEAPLDYDYMARPYQLLPRLLQQMPVPRYFAKDGALLVGDPTPAAVQRVEYRMSLRPNLQYQPHPCFAKDETGQLLYAGAACPKLPKHIKSPQDFPVKNSRNLRSEDFKVALVRLCDPRLASPVYATLSSFIAGMSDCSQQIQQALSKASEAETTAQRYPVLLDYRQFSFSGLEVINDLEFTLVLSRKYPQALYWMAMHFFAPIPWEALEFYHLKDVRDAGLNWKNWPVGSGPFMLEVMDPNIQIRLCKNPNFRTEHWDGAPGVALPFLEQIVFQYERETIPNWIKFNQGYYDTSGIPSDLLDSATTFNQNGELALSQEMRERGMKMHCSVTPTIFYFGFNMLDPLVGGNSENRRALRQAISIVLDYQEYIDIFLNGQGVPAQCVIPPGISGSQTGNDFISPWNETLQKPLRLPLQQA
ncbi:MAG: ABC transporter substrate-binding protein, partial [Lentisphaeria bacterium]